MIYRALDSFIPSLLKEPETGHGYQLIEAVESESGKKKLGHLWFLMQS